MTNKNFKMIASTVVGLIITVVNLIPSSMNYGCGYGAWMSWLYKNAPVFIAAFAISFITMTIWQGINQKSLTNFKDGVCNNFYKFCKNMS